MINVAFDPTDERTAPFDPDFAHSSEDVPERFVVDFEGDLDFDTAWAEWAELTFDPDF
jgi:hypothetical protein